ncbi:hypothetical protein [Leisingera sp. McT4-56]|uniref:hypothetical protein n=1 Tax=Leisingera sp. McT4-56 TaxID=2881255 RepID=UPI001CF81357|nr:hypothetical protein [Leisingera sp. McT4-56]MCB4455854.1 hypothetical protein [Leisingera sp. McT4-56]
MKPAFALSLSADGIALIHRAKDGWRSVGSTPFDTEDLPAALAAMRADALRLAPDGIHSKLILPNDQIRYLSIETGDLPAGERIEAARQALEGATPYTVDELAFDICANGGVTHVAAVALETLDEAETFAVEHGFGPVSFVAAPEDGGFQGEPFFGTTRAIRGTEVEPDDQAVEVIGPAALPAPGADSETEADGETGVEGEAEITTESSASAVAEDPAEEKPAQPEAARQPVPAAEEIAETSAPEPEQETGPDKPDETAAKEAPAAPQTAAPAAAPVTLPPAPPPPAQAAPAPAPEASGFSSRRAAAPEIGSRIVPPAPAPEGKTAPEKPAAALSAGLQPANAPGPVKPLGAPGADLAEDKAGPPAPPRTIPPAPAALRAPSPAAPAPPPEPAADRKTAGTGKPRFLGLALTALLLLILATVAVWALFGEDGFFGGGPVDNRDLSPAPAISTGDGQSSGTAAAPSSGTGGQPEEIAPQVSVLADQPDPGLQDTGETALPEAEDSAADPSAEDEAAADGVDLPEEGTGSAFLDSEALLPGAAEDTAPEPLDELAQAARYAATGVWPVAPELDDFPAATGLDELYTASVDHTEIAADAVALPQADSFARDDVPAAIASPAAAGSAFDLDARGLVKATPEGAVNPDGITVYLGRPKKVPPRAPDRADPAAEALAEEVARNQVLSRKRPKARPENLAEQVERAQNGGLSRAELASLRPRQRPASLKPAEEEQLPVTAQAIASSVVPRGRPANFANLVDRARRNAQNQVQTAAAVPPAAAATPPRIPTSASVARRATVSKALNLRKLNLIGVYGTASDRRALVRLPSGRYKKVQVGDRIDGGRVIAIGESQLQYQKGGRNRTLTMPNG